MIKKIGAALILYAIALEGFSQQVISPGKLFEKLSKSIVTVEVKPVPGGMNACTGFAWQSPDYIVTSLHAMAPKADIFVKYKNDLRYLREAEIVKIYTDADLVLLKVKNGRLPSLPVEPIDSSNLNTNRLEAETSIYSLGYPSGAMMASSRVLKKGYIEKPPPETLESFLPRAYVDLLRQHKFPKVDIEIIYVDGSLLPGYSGAPCLDAYGNLVGIGDGGLENGARNVSWLIPSKFLAGLETSQETVLPASSPIGLLHSGTVPEIKDQAILHPDTNVEGTNYYLPIASKDFEFYYIKNRSLQEMYETSGNDYNLIRILEEFKTEYNVTIDPQELRFDVYEDVNQGVVVAIPEGQELYFHREDNHFQVSRKEETEVNILFNGLTGDLSNLKIDTELDNVYRWLLDTMQTYWNVKNFEIDDNFTRVDRMYDNPNIKTDDNRWFANVLMTSEPVMDAKLGGFCRIYLYVSMLLAPDKSFLSVASYKISIDKMEQAKSKGVNCYDSASMEGDCAYFQTFVKAFCSAHLTTFAY